MYDLGSPSKLGQYTHLPGQPKNSVSSEITVTPERLRTHRFLNNLIKAKSHPILSFAPPAADHNHSPPLRLK